MTPIDNILNRLDGVKSTGKNRWQARCPAHSPDKNPSLCLAETSDGTALIKCQAGCSAYEIVTAIGLELKHLFPQPERTSKRKDPIINYKNVLALLENETTFVFLAADHLSKNGKLSEHDENRLTQAVANLNRILEVTRL